MPLQQNLAMVQLFTQACAMQMTTVQHSNQAKPKLRVEHAPLNSMEPKGSFLRCQRMAESWVLKHQSDARHCTSQNHLQSQTVGHFWVQTLKLG
jgi:hypothetical protein